MTGPDGPDNGSPGSDLILSGARDRIPAPAQSEDRGTAVVYHTSGTSGNVQLLLSSAKIFN